MNEAIISLDDEKFKEWLEDTAFRFDSLKEIESQLLLPDAEVEKLSPEAKQKYLEKSSFYERWVFDEHFDTNRKKKYIKKVRKRHPDWKLGMDRTEPYKTISNIHEPEDDNDELFPGFKLSEANQNAVLKSLEPYGVTSILDLSEDAVDDFIKFNIAMGFFNEIEDACRAVDKDYSNLCTPNLTPGAKIYQKFMRYLDEPLTDEEYEERNGRFLDEHIKFIEEAEIVPIVHENGDTNNKSPLSVERITEHDFDEIPEDKKLVDKSDTDVRMEHHVELTPEARDIYENMAQNEYADIQARQLGVKGLAMDDDLEKFAEEVQRVQNDPNVKAIDKSRLEHVLQSLADNNNYLFLTDEQLKALFYLPRHSRWFKRPSEKVYPEDALADAYSDEHGMVERASDKSVIDLDRVRDIRLTTLTDLQNKLSVAVDNLRPQLLALGTLLNQEQLSHLSVLFKVAGLDFDDVIQEKQTGESTNELLISELYEVLYNYDEIIYPNVKMAKDIVFKLDDMISKKIPNITPKIYKTLVDLAFLGFINSKMSEYTYISAWLSLAIEYFEAHPMYTFVYDNKEYTVNMLERLHARKGQKINPLETPVIDEIKDLGGEEMITVQDKDIIEKAAAAVQSNFGPTAGIQIGKGESDPWGIKKENTAVLPNATIKQAAPYNSKVPTTNLFNTNAVENDKKTLMGQKDKLPMMGEQPAPVVNPNLGMPSAQIVEYRIDPNIDKDYSFGTQYLWGLPEFKLTEEMFYINDKEVAVKYADGRVFVVNNVWIPLMQAAWSLIREAKMKAITANGGYPRPTEFGSTDTLQIGSWNNFPAHYRYKVCSTHDNVFRVEVANNNNNNNFQGGINMQARTINGMDGFGTGVVDNRFNTAAGALAGMPGVQPTVQPVAQPAVQQPAGYDVNSLLQTIQQLQAQIATLQAQVQAQSVARPSGPAQINNSGYTPGMYTPGYNNYNTQPAAGSIYNFAGYNTGYNNNTGYNPNLVNPLAAQLAGATTQTPGFTNYSMSQPTYNVNLRPAQVTNTGVYNPVVAPVSNYAQPAYNYSTPAYNNYQAPAVNNTMAIPAVNAFAAPAYNAPNYNATQPVLGPAQVTNTGYNPGVYTPTNTTYQAPAFQAPAYSAPAPVVNNNMYTPASPLTAGYNGFASTSGIDPALMNVGVAFPSGAPVGLQPVTSASLNAQNQNAFGVNPVGGAQPVVYF